MAIEEDDPVAFANIRSQLQLGKTIEYYFPSIVIQDKQRILSFFCGTTNSNTPISTLAEHFLKQRLADHLPFFHVTPEVRDSLFSKYLVHHYYVVELILDPEDKRICRILELELALERRNEKTVKRLLPTCDLLPSKYPFSFSLYPYEVGCISNYDRPELYHLVTAEHLGPLKPQLLKEYIGADRSPGKNRVAAVKILYKLTKCGSPHPDPHDKEVFKFLASYVNHRMGPHGCHPSEIDTTLGLKKGTLADIITTAVRRGSVRVLRWLLRIFPHITEERCGVPRQEIPTSSRMVFREKR